MTANGWEKAAYTIQVNLHNRIISQEVDGIVESGFGIHETGGVWNITYLATGWNCFTAATSDGAKILARHLIKNYQPKFERLIISGTTVENYHPLDENYHPLEEKITTDGELAHLKKLYADDGSDAKKCENRMIMKIIS